MKNILWDIFDADKAVSSKVPASMASQQGKGFMSDLEKCATKSGDVLDESELSTPSVLKGPLLILFALIVLPWAIQVLISTRSNNFSFLSNSNAQKVPIYIKLGQLVYYS